VELSGVYPLGSLRAVTFIACYTADPATPSSGDVPTTTQPAPQIARCATSNTESTQLDDAIGEQQR
jgi:hypothetical protein